MHELSVCLALLTQVKDISSAHGGANVKRIILAVGPLSGVEPHLLASAFQIGRAGSCAAKAELIFETAQVRVRCRGCGEESECEANRLLCAKCGGYRTQVVSGDELLLLRVELSSVEDVRETLVQS